MTDDVEKIIIDGPIRFDPASQKPVYQCQTCGNDTLMEGTRRCHRCWEFETRLKDYLLTQNGPAFVLKTLAELNIGPDAENILKVIEMVKRRT